MGRNVISWKQAQNRSRELASTDLSGGQENWKFVFDESAEVDIAFGRYVAVVDTKGRSFIIDAENGEVLVEDSVERVASIGGVHLIAGSDHFTLAVQTKQAKNGNRRRILAVNKFDFPLFEGHLYVYKRSDGKPAFPGPATIQQHGLMLSQPTDLPVIPFVSNHPRQTSRGGSNSLRLTLLERSSGRLLYLNEELPISVNHFLIKASDTEPDKILVEMMSKNLTLEFSNNPRPPEPPFRQELFSKESKGILGIAEGLFE